MVRAFQLQISGTKLMCHAPTLVDPLSKVTKQFQSISKKTTKTDADHVAMAELEWYAGLYLAPGIDGPAVPTEALLTCLWEGAKKMRKGDQIKTGIEFSDQFVPLVYDGPRDIDKLVKLPRFHDRRPVVISRSRIMRTRPVFRNWALVADGMFDDSKISIEDLNRIITKAGEDIGLLEMRTKKFGRFTGKATEV